MKLSAKKFNIWLRNYFGFSNTETRSLKILFPILFTFAITYSAINRNIAWWPNTYVKDSILLDSLYRAMKYTIPQVQDGKDHLQDSNYSILVSSNFDPNTIDDTWIQRNGFPEQVGRNWVNYIKSGGRFRVSEDLMKIYGMTPSLYKDIAPYVTLSTRKKKLTTLPEKPILEDLNLSDTTLLKRVYGVGSKLAARIINFRDALGGFVAMDQLYQVYYLDSQVVERIMKEFFIAEDFQPSKLTVNTDSLEYLAKHPYISFQEAKLLIAYRNQHGNIQDLEELLSIPVIDEDKLNKLRPYLTVELE